MIRLSKCLFHFITSTYHLHVAVLSVKALGVLREKKLILFNQKHKHPFKNMNSTSVKGTGSFVINVLLPYEVILHYVSQPLSPWCADLGSVMFMDAGILPVLS